MWAPLLSLSYLDVCSCLPLSYDIEKALSHQSSVATNKNCQWLFANKTGFDILNF